MISSRQLEYFRAVARELHFTRAAEQLHIAQPALSRQIRGLERQLGLALLDRDRHGVRLTPPGAALLAHAERVLSDLAAVEEEMAGWATGVRGRIRLGTARGVAARLADVLSGFAGRFPGVDVELREQTTAEMIADLNAGRLDVATPAAAPPVGDQRLEWRPLGSEPLVLICGHGSAFAARRRVRIAELDGVDLVLYGQGSAIRAAIAAALEQAQVHARVRFETREYNTARILANAGLAVAMVPEAVAREPGPAIHVVRLQPEPTWSPVLAWSAVRRPAPALSAFIEFVLERPEGSLIGPQHADGGRPAGS